MAKGDSTLKPPPKPGLADRNPEAPAASAAGGRGTSKPITWCHGGRGRSSLDKKSGLHRSAGQLTGKTGKTNFSIF